MSRNKNQRLEPQSSSLEIFTALRQLPALTAADCRRIVALQSSDGVTGTRTATRPEHIHPVSSTCLETCAVKDASEGDIQVPYMSLQKLLQAKLSSSKLFATCFDDIFARCGRCIRVIVYNDEVTSFPSGEDSDHSVTSPL